MRSGRLLAALFLAACAGSDGVILQVGVNTPDLQPERLVFRIGLPAGERWIRDPSSSIDVDLSGRSLWEDPYRLLLTEGPMAAGVPFLAAALGETSGRMVGFAALPPRHFASGGGVLLHTLLLEPGKDVVESATGCLTFTVAGTSYTIASPDDRDCDGARPGPGGDCDDDDPLVGPDAPEVCDNGRDDDCDGATDEHEDADGDGFDICNDCDDSRASVHPGAAEVCDGRDNDCDGACDEGHDADGDGVTVCGTLLSRGRCAGSALPDCRDDDPLIHPGATEICDGVDNDCDGLCDEAPASDADGDGFTICGTVAGAGPAPCPPPAPLRFDCRDDDPDVHPFMHELCDGKDNDCDGVGLAQASCFRGGDPCLLGTQLCDDDASDGTSGLDPTCVGTDHAVLVDPAVCAASCTDDPDPFRCAFASAASSTHDCRLALSRTAAGELALCPGTRTPLPPIVSPSGCRYGLVGGLEQDQLGAGLAAGDEPPAAILSECSGWLVVTAVAHLLAPQPDELLVLAYESADPAGAAVRFAITPFVVAECPLTPLLCEPGD